MNKRLRYACQTLASLSFLLTHTVASESLDDELYFDMSLEDLLNVEVVSASLFRESRKEAAASVERFDASVWQAWGLRQTSEVVGRSHSVQTYETFFGGHAYAIRGYSQFLSVRGVSTMIDGVAVNDMIFGSSQYENEHTTLGVLDSIELIKGPGSTLHGTDAFHGALQLNTFYETENAFELSGQLGHPTYKQLNTKWSQKLHEQLILNLAADVREQSAWDWTYQNQNTGAEDHRDRQYETGSVNLKLHNADNAALQYAVSLYANKMEGSGFVGGGGAFWLCR